MLLALCFKENITILTKPYDRKRDQAPFWTMQGLKDDERLEKRLPDRSVTRMKRMRRENLWTLRECKILGKGSSSHSDGRRKFLLDASIMYKSLTQKLFVQGVFTQLASSYWACILEQQKVFSFLHIKRFNSCRIGSGHQDGEYKVM